MRTLLAALIVAAAAAAATADDNEPECDLAKLQGKWKGMAGPSKEYTIVTEIKGKSVTTSITNPSGETFQIKGEVEVDDTAKPKQLDWVKFAHPDGSGDFEPNLSIYELDGDKLKVCSGGPGNARPTEFKAGDEGRPSLIEFERVKEEKKE